MLRVCAGFVLALWAGAAAADPVAGAARVIDGDTLEVAGETVRLHGIDAPEARQTCRDAAGAPWACGRWATGRLAALVAGARVACAGRERDRYGRLVATCRARGRDLGAAMVEQGAAWAFRRYSLAYVDHEKRALFARRGVWQGGAERPADLRSAGAGAGAGQAAAEGPRGCRIKGNVSANGRIYHRPGQAHYDRTRISPGRGERWFCSAAEAEAAGWRAARR